MAEEKTGSVECMVCHCGSQERPLVALVYKSQSQWVCVSCLPVLIHGSQ